MKIDKTEVLTLLNERCIRHYGCDITEAAILQIYKTVCIVVRDLLIKKRKKYADQVKAEQAKQVYYMSMEFLVGTSLRNNLYNLGIEDSFEQALKELNRDLHELYQIEPDAGLGNGGLGRLASCYLDSLTTKSIPTTGFSIRYEFGISKQRIIDGWQVEFPDDWLNMGDVWLIPRSDESYEVKFGGYVEELMVDGKYTATHRNYETVIAVPYDMMISGYDTNAVNDLVLWSAKSPNHMDMSAFSRGEYVKALEQHTMAEVITKVLYPADDHMEGKRLRIKQQYLLVSASLQSIINSHLKQYGTLNNLADKVAIHINDTHPALCVPELMRILLDDYGYEWNEAWSITGRTLAYTNHTVMSEALERWPEHLFREQMPRIYQLVGEINRRLILQLHQIFPGDQGKIDYMAILSYGQVHMANLCLAACHSVNGVSKLHSDILKTSIFKDYYTISPDKFMNVTNGIAYRRWLCQSNPGLTNLLCELIGDDFIQDAAQLEQFMSYYDNQDVLAELRQIKYQNKLALCNYMTRANGIKVDPNSIFDVQVKRLHEYKRQLLNVLHIIYLYNQIKNNPSMDIMPRTFIFAAKASSGYIRAKQIIQLITTVSRVVNADPIVRDKIKIIFIEDYKVSLAEIIMPAADISEQISIAGKEASGTGNMKLMINGAVTLGTLDGANVEILEQVGRENMFLFGLTTPEVDELWRKGYHPEAYYEGNRELKEAVDTLTSGALGIRFDDIARSLLAHSFGAADVYMNLADFASYAEAQQLVANTYADKHRFTNMSLVNIAKAGIFSSERSVQEYADRIWNANGVI